MQSNDESRGKPMAPSTTALDSFFHTLEESTTDPIHQRFVRAAQQTDTASALDRELTKIIKEILDET